MINIATFEIWICLMANWRICQLTGTCLQSLQCLCCVLSLTSRTTLIDVKLLHFISRKPSQSVINRHFLPVIYSNEHIRRLYFLWLYCSSQNFWAFNVIIWRIVLGYKSYIAMNHKILNKLSVTWDNQRSNHRIYNSLCSSLSSLLPLSIFS